MPILLTDKIITEPVTKRRRLFDSRCDGLYADITPFSVSFRLKVWNAARAKQDAISLGRYNPEAFTVEHARKKAWGLMYHGGDVAARAKDAQAAIDVQGTTFNQAADEYIAWCQQPIKQFGELLPRKASWRNNEYSLVAARAAFGRKAIGAVTAKDIAILLRTFTDAHKNHMATQVRGAINCVFKFAGNPERGYVEANPCLFLGERPKLEAKDRFLTDAEIRVLWHGLDRPDCPAPRPIVLALKLILTTALRPTEVLTAQRREVGPLSKQQGGDGLPAYRIPPTRVKLRRPVVQPLNTLAQEIVDELIALDGQGGLLFPSGKHGAPLKNTDLSTALHGKWQITTARKYKQAGLCEWLGLKKFTPHDLRRTAATQLGLAGVSDGAIAQVLDHQKKAGEGATASTLIYNRAITNERRATLDKLDTILRDIIGPAPASNVVKLKVA
jgi:integrase